MGYQEGKALWTGEEKDENGNIRKIPKLERLERTGMIIGGFGPGGASAKLGSKFGAKYAPKILSATKELFAGGGAKASSEVASGSASEMSTFGFSL
ncbi:hypothetical protein ACE5IS_19585 [Leptospira wolffii]|uniref:Uncharacterized protein n=1 Tax=Leptospira wolffii TaxID=409998 RepID=A0ABV5BU22_9LEPT